MRIWKEYYMELMNKETERARRENDGERVNLEVESISKEEVREKMQRMKERKGGRSRRHTSGGMGMSRRECTEVTDETVQQQNDGK